MSTGGPDLFVVCKNCGSEVSPYITECPYCGNRLRKRAPKIDREGRVTERHRRLRAPTPSLPRLKTGEIPGIRGDSRPYATVVLVVLGLVGCLLWRTGLFNDSYAQLAIIGRPTTHHLWKLLTAPFVYNNTGFAFVSLAAIALYGWLLERRHGMLVIIVLFLLGGVGGMALTTGLLPHAVALGGNGAALALIVAWAVPDLISLRRGEEVDGDLLGTVAFAAVVALMPLAVSQASWLADGTGVLAGLLVGWPLALLADR
ncbi:MAG TPA: rhomboid family intramembrane serine protease [Solirubrobacteraceae bacterium]|nr:rhomboid family intramembrane serine protease [Solirubrobacteraceae bacterium]